MSAVVEPEVEAVEPEIMPQGSAAMEIPSERRMAAGEAPPDANSLLADAMRVPDISLADRLLLMEKIEGIFVARQKAEAERAFFAALSAFQRECPVVTKTKPVYNKDGNKIRYYYAPLGDIVDQVGSLLASHGLSYDFSDSRVIPFEDTNGGPYMELTCNVHHSGGHSRPFPYRVVIEDNEWMSATQHGGEANSYARRYAFTNAFGILTADNDFDGNDPARMSPAEARAMRPPVSQPQQKPTAQRKAAATKAANGVRMQIQPASEGETIEASTIKVLTSKMENAALSNGDLKKRFPAITGLEQINRKDINIVLGWLMDPQNA